MQGLNNFIDYIYSKKYFAELDGVKAFLNNLDSMHYFYNKIISTNQELLKNVSNNDIKLINTPFQNIWIENVNISMTILNQSDLKLNAIGILEFNPTKQMIYFSVSNDTKTMLYCGCFSIINNRFGFGFMPNKVLQAEYEKTCRIIYAWLCLFEKQLKKENIQYLQNDSKLNKKGRIGRIFKKVKYAPKDVIYVCKKSVIKKDSTLSKRIINKPQYAYEVMGHWRKINSIGKDRQGNRVVNGFTWVSPYTKGNGEVMKKVRIINESEVKK